MKPSRRQFLVAGAGAGVTILTGCIAEAPEDNGDENDGTPEDLPGPVTDYTVVSVTREYAGDWWREPDDGPGIAVVLTDPDEVRAVVETDEEVEQFIDETDFAADAVYYLEGVGPNACYSRLDVEELVVIVNGDYTLQATVRARDVSDDDEDCPQVHSFPSVLLRVESEVTIDDATFRMVDGWENEDSVSPMDIGTFAQE
ncbi:hypothetical protein AArcSl_0701 [Halalkaliarchaeum desulfuricum]|uniref:Uncharacterized protein n=1 Tax=Halalkaliarchaeum desulfuricum TaxID=2055893 RepID=A0A343TGX8_9EURY|nr:twin-arginine translocation signal domain-containing protein [Halalkaliarchaeum desulfuricum]AUX08350.1 hypothetical protein AArcSl_0701 [Halalkaliarchaeum desulfuricum]